MKTSFGKDYLVRSFDSVLATWKERKDRLPLIVKGARQVGKTECIRQFARPRYESFVEVNFVEKPDFKGVVQDGFSAEAIRRNLTRLDPSVRLPAGRTLLFFDEIQDAPEVATALKFLAQDGRADVICSGSLLGIHYKRIPSIAVGYQETLEMRSLDFREFLLACGYPPDLPDEWLGRLVDARPFSVLECKTFGRLFLDYCTLGGMPDVLSRYFENRSFEGTLDAQRRILGDYRSDVRKYADGLDQTRILAVFDAIPAQLAKENRKFQISKVAHGARFREYWGCVEWLRDAGVATVCPAMNFPELPLKGNVDPSRFKLYMADSGLLLSMLDDEAQADVRARRNLGTWKGGFFENVVSEALLKAGADTAWWKRENATLEMDFFLRCRDRLVPVEVKAENARGKSLRTLIDGEHYPDVAWGVKIVNGNVGWDRRILTIPQWCAFLLPRLLREGGPVAARSL